MSEQTEGDNEVDHERGTTSSRRVLMAGLLHFFIVVFFLSLDRRNIAEAAECFSDERVQPVPKTNMFSSKTKPLVIGHRGNPMIFQENTLEGFKSLMDTNADGFELDVYLTKDNQLVLFHDDDTTFLTGEKHLMWEMTYEEIRKLNIKKTMVKGNRTWHFENYAKIPLLRDVLEAVRQSELLMYLEIKPSYTRNVTESKAVGKAVAQLVRELELERRVMINSFDPLKCLAAKQENPALSVGMFYKRDFWKPEYANTLKDVVGKLPGMAKCVKMSPNGTEFLLSIFQSGAILKSINGSFVDMDYKIYDNPLYSNDTFHTLLTNYSPSISAGAWTLYSMSESEAVWEASEPKIARLIKQGVERLITDNVTRMLEKLDRPITPTTVAPTSNPNSGGREVWSLSHLLFSIFMVLLALG